VRRVYKKKKRGLDPLKRNHPSITPTDGQSKGSKKGRLRFLYPEEKKKEITSPRKGSLTPAEMGKRRILKDKRSIKKGVSFLKGKELIYLLWKRKRQSAGSQERKVSLARFGDSACIF